MGVERAQEKKKKGKLALGGKGVVGEGGKYARGQKEKKSPIKGGLFRV